MLLLADFTCASSAIPVEVLQPLEPCFTPCGDSAMPLKGSPNRTFALHSPIWIRPIIEQATQKTLLWQAPSPSIEMHITEFPHRATENGLCQEPAISEAQTHLCFPWCQNVLTSSKITSRVSFICCNLPSTPDFPLITGC